MICGPDRLITPALPARLPLMTSAKEDHLHTRLVRRRLRAAYLHSDHKDRIDRLATRLLDGGYHPHTVAQHISEWLQFAAVCDRKGLALPSRVHDPIVVRYLSKRAERCQYGARHVRTSLHMLLETDFALGTTVCNRRETTPLYEQVMPEYLEYLRAHRGIQRPRSQEIYLRKLFLWLNREGVRQLDGLTPTHARDFLGTQSHLTRAALAGVSSIVRSLFRYLHSQGLVKANLSTWVETPKTFGQKKPPTVLSFEQVQKLLARVDRTLELGKRDYAMLLLAARYGMRPSDIRTLRLDDVYWRKGRISFVQQKTGHPLDLPLLPEVQDALIDYLKHGRPKCSAREVFVRHKTPVQALGVSNNCWLTMDRAMKAAKIRAGHGGLYILRHSAATRMLKVGVEYESIAAVLGHSDTSTVHKYAHVDLESLRTVAMTEAEVLP